MRISGGQWRSRQLISPQGRDIRPTAQIVKEGLFNMLQGRLHGARMLDIFAGTGQMGLEALSRGAAQAVFIDRNLNALTANASLIGVTPECIKGDFKYALRELEAKGRRFDIIFADPPYEAGFYPEIMLMAGALMNKDSVLALEHDSRENILPLGGLKIIKQRKYGRRAITLLALLEV